MYQNIHFDKFNNTIHLWDDVIGYKSFRFKRYAYKITDQSSTYTITGIPVEKIGYWNEEDILADKIFEHDVNPEMRTLIDLYTEDDSVSKNHHTVILDIEVETEQGLPDIQKADKKITAITVYHQAQDSYYTWVLIKDNKDLKPIADVNGKNTTLFFTDEAELLLNFLDKWNEIKPTILTGWNIDFFDVPYLYRRIVSVLGFKYGNLLSPIGTIHYNEYRQRFFIAGISCLDYMQVYKKFTFNEESSYSLDSICQKELKRGKIKFDMTLQQLYETDLEMFVKYNINDVELITDLDKKLKFLDLVKGICHKGHVPYEDIFMSSRYLEGAILTFIKRQNRVSTNKPKKIEGKKFPGAYVKDPKRGLHKWIFDLDLTSLYPSIIMSLNISPEMKLGKIENWDSEKFIKDPKTQFLFTQVDGSNFMCDVNKLISDDLAIAANGVVYASPQDTLGILPQILNKWFNERIEYKNLMKKYGKENSKEQYEYYKDLQNIVKVMLNSLYGVLGLTSFRFYDRDNAWAVTATGVQIIQYAEQIGNTFYNKMIGTEDIDYCLASDTDSVFFAVEPFFEKKYPKASDADKEKLVAMFATKMQKTINDAFNEFAKSHFNISKHRFDIKQELISKSGLWVAKKRYIQWIINNNGVPTDKIEVKGIDVVRSNFPQEYRDFMKKFLTDILKGGVEETITNQILGFKKNLGYLSVDRIAKPTSIKEMDKFYNPLDKPFKGYPKGAPAHAKASINYNSLLKHYNLTNKYQLIGNNTKIKWVYLLENPFDIETVAFLIDSPKEILDFTKKYNDALKMFEHELRGKIDDFYNALMWDSPFTTAHRAKKFFSF